LSPATSGLVAPPQWMEAENASVAIFIPRITACRMPRSRTKRNRSGCQVDLSLTCGGCPGRPCQDSDGARS
jgi:hypothetical protein